MPATTREYRFNINTFITSQAPNTAQFGSPQILAGTFTLGPSSFYYRMLFRYDITEIPIGSTIHSASLKVFPDTAFFDLAGGNVFYCRKCTKDLVIAEATWNRYNSSSLWTSVGGDFSVTDQDQITITDNSPNYLLFPNLKNLVEDAFAGDGIVRLGVIGPQITSTRWAICRSSTGNQIVHEYPVLTVILTPPPGSDVRINTHGVSSQTFYGTAGQFKVNPAMESHRRRRGITIHLGKAKPTLTTQLGFFEGVIGGMKYLTDEFEYTDVSQTLVIKSITGIDGFTKTADIAIPITYVSNSDRAICSNLYPLAELISGG